MKAKLVVDIVVDGRDRRLCGRCRLMTSVGVDDKGRIVKVCLAPVGWWVKLKFDANGRPMRRQACLAREARPRVKA